MGVPKWTIFLGGMAAGPFVGGQGARLLSYMTSTLFPLATSLNLVIRLEPVLCLMSPGADRLHPPAVPITTPLYVCMYIDLQ